MPDVDLERVRSLAGALRDALRQLRAIGGRSREAVLADRMALNGAKYLLIVTTGAALDLCAHVAARRGGRSPDDYADCFAVLEEIGAIDLDLRGRLARMARFRNLLVHLYGRHDQEVYRVIRDQLGGLDAYLASLGRYLRAELG